MITEYPALAAHLWQSTVFAGAAGLLTLLLRKNPARTRYWVWLAALVKFLVPFGGLMSMGAHLSVPGWQPKAPLMVQPAISFLMGDLNESALPVLKEVLGVSQPTNSRLLAILLGVWVSGFVAIAFRWLQRWIRVRADARAAKPLPIEIGIPVVSSPVLREPGVFGVFRPVLLLPEGMAEHLCEAEWEAILAHELCHARCYDNLTAAIYMLVESIFWFHPLVWWMGKRLVIEREFACDEEVLRLGSEPKVYAEGILKVCELYLESPLECVAGVTGSNLRRRLRAILAGSIAHELTARKKLSLALAGLGALAMPVAVGVFNASAVRAQNAAKSEQPGVSPMVTRPFSFEVASVKVNRNPPSGARAISLRASLSHGTLRFEALNLRNLILQAYNVQRERLQGCPSWCDSEFFDVMAKAEDPNATPAQVEIMLQALLADRFRLVLHREKSELPGYTLVLGKNGPKLKASKDEGSPSFSTSGYLRIFQRMPVAGLVNFLAGSARRPVTDSTGLTGSYDFTIDVTPDNDAQQGAGPLPAADPTNGFSLLSAAVEEQLGLKLQPQRVSVENLVIDAVAQPSEN